MSKRKSHMTPDLKIQEAYQTLLNKRLKSLSEEVIQHHREIADKALRKAEKAKEAGNMGEYHKHMISHHAAMSHAFEEEGKYQSAGSEYGKMKQHQKESE